MDSSILSPIYNYDTYELEDKVLYLERIFKLLPNFPKEVIIQWFYGHPQQAHEHAWLNYQNLKFELTTWKTEEVPICNYGNTDAVETYSYNYFKKGNMSNRREKLEQYFQANGTWPIAPIFLKNEFGNLKYPHGFPCGKPFHLLDGHNRMAFFLEYKRLKKLSQAHFVYIAERI